MKQIYPIPLILIFLSSCIVFSSAVPDKQYPEKSINPENIRLNLNYKNFKYEEVITRELKNLGYKIVNQEEDYYIYLDSKNYCEKEDSLLEEVFKELSISLSAYSFCIFPGYIF